MTDRKTRFLLAKQLEESRAIRDSLTPRVDGSDELPTSTTMAENRVKAREVLAAYDAGRPLDVVGDGWLIRFASHIVKLSHETAPSTAEGGKDG